MGEAIRRLKYLSKVLRIKVYNKFKFEFVYFSNAAGNATATVGRGFTPPLVSVITKIHEHQNLSKQLRVDNALVR